ncbi:MAG: FAD-dependent monooxygenase [Burkholderiaceae bacterium]|nr:FAD-dependent monooxygenase [Burkholderiaceae bacterium]
MPAPIALVAGGGIGGLTTALCLAQAGFQVRVFEQSEGFQEIGAGIQLSPNGTRVLHRLGLAAGLREIAFLPESTEMRDWRDGSVIASNPLGDALLSHYGFPYYHVHRADLMQVLAAATARVPAITLHANVRVAAVRQTGDTVIVEAGGQQHSGALLVGADGIHSIVRAHLFGAQQPTFTGNIAWRALVPARELPEGLVRPVTTAWWGPGRHFVHYYVRGGELVNCVCVVEKTGWQHESWTERGDRAELERDFAGWHPAVRTLIEAMDPAQCFKWALFDRPPMPRWSEGCVTLLGDACHPTLPFMAQGAVMAIEDAAVLARCVAGGRAIAQGLATYESLRRPRTSRIQAGSRRNAWLFHLSGIPAWLRNRQVGSARGTMLDWLYRYDAFEPLPGERP